MRPGASSLSYDDMYDMHLRDLSALGRVRIENPKSDAGKQSAERRMDQHDGTNGTGFCGVQQRSDVPSFFYR